MVLPKLVVFDVDGTLLNWDGQLSPAAHRSLKQLRSLDIPVVLATGRPMAVAQETLLQVGGASWMACGNGSVLFEVATGKVLRDRCLPGGIAVALVRALRVALPGIGCAVELTDALLEEPGFARRVPETPQMPPVDDIVTHLIDAEDKVRRIIVFHDDFDDRLNDLARIVSPHIDERCQMQTGGLPFIDIAPAGEHKAAALQVLVDHLGLRAEEVIAFGDGGNDAEMLQWAGTGVAMANARPEVQAVADRVGGHIDGEGVAAVLEPLLAPYL